jgi:hypothetical protein
MGFKSYFVRKRARFISMMGKEVNIPYGTILDAVDDFIQYRGEPLSYAVSDNARNFMVQNDDGEGERRAYLVNEITKALETHLPDYDPREEKRLARWSKIWEDNICEKYRRKDHDDFWLWNQDFFNAPTTDLTYIARLIEINIK